MDEGMMIVKCAVAKADNDKEASENIFVGHAAFSK
jgi:hypothetical protein